MKTWLFKLRTTDNMPDDPRWMGEWLKHTDLWLIEARGEDHAKSFIGASRVLRCDRVPDGHHVNLKTIDPDMSGRYWATGNCGIICASCLY